MANITYIRIDDEVYALHDDNALTSDSSLDASKVVGTLPANTYTDTTYESKAAVEGGTDVSLVTTGDKYRWNNASGGGVSDVEVNGSSVVSGGIAEITVPTNTSDLINDSNFQNATQVDTAINTRIASVYKAKGSVAFLDLPALTSSNEGFVYDINESFTTTSDFVEGAGVTYPAGTNVVIIDIGSGVYKYDVLAGLVDLSGKQDLLVSGTNIKTINNQSLLGSGDLTISSGLQNLVDGSATGSVRGVGTLPSDLDYSTALGYATHIDNYYQLVIGSWNTNKLASNNLFVIGNGTSASKRSNALTVDETGNVDIASGAKYKINGTALSASDVGAQPTLVSGTNIKTINNQSLLGSGNLDLLGLVQKHESTYTTTGSSESTIPIGISGFRSTDVLFVDINGLDLIQGTDYTVSGTNIVLTTPITTTGTKVHFVAIRMAEVTAQDYANLKGDKGDKGDPGVENLVDGSAEGSIRGVYTAAEDSSYTMGVYAFAEGYRTKASGGHSHAEGNYTEATGDFSHAEGYKTEANESGSHAEGWGTIASGDFSHAQNKFTIAAKDNQTAIGRFNIEDTETVEANQKALIIGNGTNTNNRSNALTVDWSGGVNLYLNTKDEIDKEILARLHELNWDSCLEDYPLLSYNLAYHGSWVDSGTTKDGFNVYQSNGSYHTANAWDTVKITFTNTSNFKFYIRSYAESSYDYVLVSTLNNDYLANCTTAAAIRSAYNNTTYTKAYTRGKQSATDYEEVVFTDLDPTQEYYFYVIYQKDNGGDSNDDRGYIYVPYI